LAKAEGGNLSLATTAGTAAAQQPAPQRALEWLRRNTLGDGGVRVHSNHKSAYPEVTGYFVPTLLAYGENGRARKAVEWLLSIQHPSGAWPDPDAGKEHIFDTGQVLRGMVCFLNDARVRESARKACQWLYSQLRSDHTFGDRYHGTVPETVHLFALEPLIRVAGLLDLLPVTRAARVAFEAYTHHSDLLKPSSLTHFLAYEIEALQCMGMNQPAELALSRILKVQRPDGSIPATDGATWTCLPGQAQLAHCLYRAGHRAAADRALTWLESNQRHDGGFAGSVGPGASYFAENDPGWGVKFYLDAHRARAVATMESLAADFPASLLPDDGRLHAVVSGLPQSGLVVEVGCGKGRFARQLKQQRPTLNVVGIDLAPRLLDLAPDLPRMVGPCENLPLPSACANAAFAVEVMEHSANMLASVAELARVTAPGGFITVIDKPADKAGALATASWERWPSDKEMKDMLAEHCENVSSTAVSYDGKLADGLLMAWTGQRKSTPASTRKDVAPRGTLLVIPEQAPSAYRDRGFDAEYMARYFGQSWGDKTVIADIGSANDWPELPLPRLRLAASDAMTAWATYAQDLPRERVVDADTLRAGWPGLPQDWIAEIRAVAPTCVRAYGARWSAWLALEIAQVLNVPVQISLHNTAELSRGILHRADAIMAVSEAVAQASIEVGCDPARVVTVFNRVDRALFSPEGESASGPAGSPRLLCIARDTDQKNLDRLLAACEVARKTHPGLSMVHAGASTRDWSRWPFVTHLPAIPHPQVPHWLRWADAFVLPSLWEGFGIVFAEALACGTPVVTSSRAPMNEIVTDRWDGLLCDPESVADIARAISEIAEPATRARLAAPARTASEPFDIATIEARESALYGTLVQPQWPKLSVVLPTFNRHKLIESAVMNVLSQDYPDLELIVVNDGSSDGTTQLLDILHARLGDPRLRVLHVPNGGLPRALNHGFALASGEFWTWTSDDNAFRPGALRALARELLLDKSVGLVFADYEVVHENGDRRKVATGPASELATRNTVGACFLYRREVARQVGEYSAERALAEDWDYWRRIAAVSKIQRLPRVLYDYGDTPDSLSRTRPAEVIQAAMQLAGSPSKWNDDYHFQMVRLAGAFKSQGLPWRSLGTAWNIITHRPGSLSGYKAMIRALTPMPLLRLTRKLRGADVG